MTAHKSVTLCWRFPSLYAHLPRHLSQTTAFSQRVPSEVMYFVFHRSPTAHRLYRSLNHSFLLRPQHKKDSPLSTTEYLLINPHQQCPNRHSHSNPPSQPLTHHPPSQSSPPPLPPRLPGPRRARHANDAELYQCRVEYETGGEVGRRGRSRGEA